jgi:hypothetical protein
VKGLSFVFRMVIGNKRDDNSNVRESPRDVSVVLVRHLKHVDVIPYT